MITKRDIKKAMENKFPSFSQYYCDDSSSTVFDIPNPIADNLFGGLIIQLDHNEIWFRAYVPCSGGCCDSIDELLMIVEKLIADKVVIIVRNRKGNWNSTSLCYSELSIKLNRGYSHTVLSWSGERSKKFERKTTKKLRLKEVLRKQRLCGVSAKPN